MPIYECLTTRGTLTDAQRGSFVESVTRIHCEETGAPKDFVHVLFPELEPGHLYSAGSRARTSIIRALVRAGRPPKVRQAIIQRLWDAYLALTGADVMSVVVAVIDVPASWVMEGGMILPEPNAADEAAWMAKVGRSGEAKA